MKLLTLQNKRYSGRLAPRFGAFKQDGNPKPIALVAEDHDDTRSLLKFLLESWGFRVVEADNGHAAVELSAKENLSVIIMDIVLPSMDGLQAAQQIRLSGKSKNIPIVFVTGYVGNGIELVAKACGGNDFIEKPFDLPVLQAALIKYHPKLNRLQFA